jgi:hypothetical protein
MGSTINLNLQTKMNTNEVISAISCKNTFSLVLTGFVCNGVLSSDPSVCSGRGTCTGTNQCSCNTNYNGINCELTTCFGIFSTDNRVCSGFGTCTSFDVCTCNPQYSSDYSGDNECYRKIMAFSAGDNRVIFHLNSICKVWSIR